MVMTNAATTPKNIRNARCEPFTASCVAHCRGRRCQATTFRTLPEPAFKSFSARRRSPPPWWHAPSSHGRMKYPNGFVVGLCFALAMLLCGCKSKQNTPEDAKLKGHNYTNRFFAFQVQI